MSSILPNQLHGLTCLELSSLFYLLPLKALHSLFWSCHTSLSRIPWGLNFVIFFFFSIKIFFLGDLIQTHGFKYHLYSDDSQNDNFSPELKIYTSNFYLSLRWVICISKLTRLMANIPCPNQLYFSKWNSHLSRCSSHKLKHSLDFPPSHTGTVC